MLIDCCTCCDTPQGISHMWCDNVPQQASAFRAGFKPFLTASNAVLEDPMHVIGRYARVVPDSHPLKGKLMQRLCV